MVEIRTVNRRFNYPVLTFGTLDLLDYFVTPEMNLRRLYLKIDRGGNDDNAINLTDGDFTTLDGSLPVVRVTDIIIYFTEEGVEEHDN